jgi:hypothetical protein
MDSNIVDNRRQSWKETIHAMLAILIPTLCVGILVVAGNAFYDHMDCGARGHDAKINLYWLQMELGSASGAANEASLADLPEAIQQLESARYTASVFSLPRCAKKAQGALLDVADSELAVQYLRLEGASQEEIERATVEATARYEVFHTLMEDWVLDPPSY